METKQSKPTIFAEGKYSAADIAAFKKSHRSAIVADLYTEQLKELFEITYPKLWNAENRTSAEQAFIKKRLGKNGNVAGNWVYYPWRNTLLHMLGAADLQKVRTNRNQNLITKQEQTKLASATVAFAGLSIGNTMAVSLAYAGIASSMKIADFDTLSTANLNRIRASLVQVGMPKTDVTAQHIYELNPYAKLQVFSKGLKEKDLPKFVGSPKPALVFEAIDDFEMKIRIRMACKVAGVAVVMLTNLGDSLLIDIERYDLNKKLKIFNGLIGDVPEQILKNPITEQDKNKYAVSIVGRDNVPPRAMASLPEIHNTLVGRPQLMSTVTIGGGFAAYVARKIILGEYTKSGRIRIAFDDFLEQK